MSQPETNLPKQARRHWGPIAGITLALLVAAGAMLWWMAESEAPTAQETDPPSTVATDPLVTEPLAPPVGEPVEAAPVSPEPAGQ